MRIKIYNKDGIHCGYYGLFEENEVKNGNVFAE